MNVKKRVESSNGYARIIYHKQVMGMYQIKTFLIFKIKLSKILKKLKKNVVKR